MAEVVTREMALVWLDRYSKKEDGFSWEDMLEAFLAGAQSENYVSPTNLIAQLKEMATDSE